MTPSAPRIALISAVTSAWAPIHDAFALGFPEAELWNLLDDRLLGDAAGQGGLTPPLTGRMETLIRHAMDGGADAVLLTCSLYGPVAHDLAPGAQVPVAGPDDALFASARASGAQRIGVLSSGAAPLADSVARLREALPDREVTGILTADASPEASLDAVRAVPAPDLLVLGQYSLAGLAAPLGEALRLPVLAGPPLAVAALRSALTKEVLS